MAVLLELTKRPGEIVLRTELIATVWGGAYVCEDVVTNAVSLLRRALHDDAKSPSIIQTISKRGYRLLSSVAEEVADPNGAAAPFGEASDFSGGSGISSGLHGRLGELDRSILRVRYLRQEETVASLNSARTYGEEVVRQAPNCAAAHAELALTLFAMEKLGMVQREDVEPKVRSAVDRALCLDDCASTTLVCAAKLAYRFDWKWNNAAQHLRKATKSNPTDVDAFTELSIILSVLGRFDESLVYAKEACRLDPMSPSARLQAAHGNLGAGNWATAAGHYERLLRFTPQHVFARWGFAHALARVGQPGEAIALLEEGSSMPGVDPHPLLLTSLSRIRETVEGHARSAPGSRDVPQEIQDPLLLAEFYATAGEMTEAFKHLNQAAEVKHYRTASVTIFPQFGLMRQDPRYRKLLKRIGLRESWSTSIHRS